MQIKQDIFMIKKGEKENKRHWFVGPLSVGIHLSTKLTGNIQFPSPGILLPRQTSTVEARRINNIITQIVRRTRAVDRVNDINLVDHDARAGARGAALDVADDIAGGGARPVEQAQVADVELARVAAARGRVVLQPWESAIKSPRKWFPTNMGSDRPQSAYSLSYNLKPGEAFEPQVMVGILSFSRGSKLYPEAAYAGALRDGEDARRVLEAEVLEGNISRIA